MMRAWFDGHPTGHSVDAPQLAVCDAHIENFPCGHHLLAGADCCPIIAPALAPGVFLASAEAAGPLLFAVLETWAVAYICPEETWRGRGRSQFLWSHSRLEVAKRDAHPALAAGRKDEVAGVEEEERQAVACSVVGGSA